MPMFKFKLPSQYSYLSICFPRLVRVSLIFEIKHVSYRFGYEMCFINAGKQKGHRTSERVDINNQGDN